MNRTIIRRNIYYVHYSSVRVNVFSNCHFKAIVHIQQRREFKRIRCWIQKQNHTSYVARRNYFSNYFILLHTLLLSYS